MEKVISVGMAVELSAIVNSMASMPKNPLKFCVIRNAKELKCIVEKFELSRGELFNDSVLLNEDGNPSVIDSCIETVKELQAAGEGVPWNFYQYKSEDSKKVFFNELKDLMAEEVTVNLKSESLSRPIRVTLPDGSNIESTIESVLEDPSNNIDVNMLSILMDCGILVD